jgi:tetratricopeptide (TPR) repeat protein
MVNYLLVAAGCLVIGFFAGFYISNNLNRNAELPGGAVQNQSNPPLFNQQTDLRGVKEPGGAMMPDVAETLNLAKTQPDNFEAQMKAGDMYRQIQNSEKAGAFYDAAAALKPTEPEKIVRLANSFFDIRQYEKAEPLYAQALEKKPDEVDVRADFAITFIERGNPDYERGIKELQTALKLNPKHEVALYYMSLASYRKGDAENAQKYLTQLEQANPDSRLVGRLKQIIKQ